jgi:choline transporter-like protein 2/4/5
MLWCNRTSLETAIAIIDASADFFIDTKRLIFVSIMYFFIGMFIFFLWLGALACVASLSTFEPPATKGDQLKLLKPDGKVWAMIAFLAFGMLWAFQFISDKTKFITMVSASTYYFDSNASKDGSASVCTGFRFAYGKNMGSIAFGSLILTIVGILRAIVETMAESANKDGDGAAKLIACIAQCLMACLESIIEHLSKLAYAYMAVTGDSFCSSAWNGFILNLKHLAKFVFALNIAGLFIFMGVVTITCVNTGIGYLLMTYAIKDGAHEGFNVVPSLVAFGIVSFLVAIIFLG